MRRIPLLLLVLLHLALSWHFWWLCDDAFISFRYARNLAEGSGLRFNPGEHVPVEGYSNFLWVMIAAAAARIGLAIPTVMPSLSWLCGGGLVVAVHRVAERSLGLGAGAALTAALAVAISPAVVIWGTSGLATVPAALLLLVATDRLVLSTEAGATRSGALAALALALIRTEGVGWGFVLTVLALGVRRLEPGRHRDDATALLTALGPALVVYGAYFGWRSWYFQSWIANTASAKLAFGADTAARGASYVIAFGLASLAPVVHLALLPSAWVARWRGLVIGLMFVGVGLFAVLVGGDFMAMGRLLVAGASFGALLLACAVSSAGRPRAAVVAAALVSVIGALPLAEVHLVPGELRKPWRVRHNTKHFRSEIRQWAFMRSNTRRWISLGKALAAIESPGESLVLGAIGAAGFHSHLFIHDRYGLVTRAVAEREVEAGASASSPGHDKEVLPAFFLELEPTYLRVELLASKGAMTKARELGEWWDRKPEIAALYAPRLDRVEVDGRERWLLTLARSEHPRRARAAFDELVAR